jgi:TetR/AcrR family tetracycline transcriptional repressor
VALDRERIVAEAVALLDEGGLEGLTLRRLAERLGVRAPTLYWHVRNKAALVTAVAEEMLAAEFSEPCLPNAGEPWQDWLIRLAERLRHALLAHPDGARVLSAAQLSLRMADLTELAVRTLVELGLPLREARLTVLAVERLTIGHVLEEQAPRPDAADFDLEAYTARYPTLVAGITEYFQDGRTVDDLFRDTLRQVLR